MMTKMIEITKSVNADSRTSNDDVTVENLRYDTESHISDVTKGLDFVAELIKARGPMHDHTKLENLEEFYQVIKSNHIKDTNWYHKHVTEEKHHLKTYVHEDITLVDVIEHVVDCTMAGLARSGSVYDIDLPTEVLQLAVKNTVDMLIRNTNVSDPQKDILDEEI
jgi:hypothetical protein